MKNFYPDKTISIDPATGEQIGISPEISITELEEIFKISREALVLWSALAIEERVKYLIKVRDYIVERIDSFAETISKDTGKLKLDALTGELIPITIAIGYYCKNAPKWLKNEKIKSASILLSFKRSFIRRLPLGVVGIISPWNYPFSIPMFEIIPGLLAGNSIILKTATETQMVSKIIEEAFTYAQLPKGVLNIVNMPGRIMGDALINLGVDKLFFTGSFEVGRTLAKSAGEKLISVNLELGGNDSMIVCNNADIDRAVGGAIWGGFHNSGQSCGGIERIYVDSQVYDEFILKLKGRVENLIAGNGLDYSNDLGCITTKKQKATIEKQVEDALAKGAVLFARSKIKDNKLNNFLPAMVLTNVNHEMQIMNEETFGPVVCVMKVNSIDEAIELANDSDMGLTASVWTGNNKHAIEISNRIKAGVVNINDHLMSHGLAETPWGGFKNSGKGRSHGKFGFEEMTETQVVVRDILPFVKKDLWWHPYSAGLYEGLRGMLIFRYGKGILNRLSGFIKLAAIVPRIFNQN